VVKPSQRKEMAQQIVASKGISIRLACRAFGVSESCYRYQPKLQTENDELSIIEEIYPRDLDIYHKVKASIA